MPGSTANPAIGGKLIFNLGNISEDVLKDGKKQYENGLPEDGNIAPLLQVTQYGRVVPRNQSLIYDFSTAGDQSSNQDVGYVGNDAVSYQHLTRRTICGV